MSYAQLNPETLYNKLYVYITGLVGGDDLLDDKDHAVVDQLINIFIAFRSSNTKILPLFSYEFLATLPLEKEKLYACRDAALHILESEESSQLWAAMIVVRLAVWRRPAVV